MQTDKKDNQVRKKSAGLLQAYKALRADYTQKCQLISALRGENDALKSRISALEGDFKEKTDYPTLVCDDDFIAKYLVDNEKIKRIIIDEYLRSLNRPTMPVTLCSAVGRTALTPVPKPKSLAEAKMLAELVIKN